MGLLSLSLNVDVNDVAEVGEGLLEDFLRHPHAMHVHRVAFGGRVTISSVLSIMITTPSIISVSVSYTHLTLPTNIAV